MSVQGVEVRGPVGGRFGEVLVDGALALLATLHRELDGERRALLERRRERQLDLDAGGSLDFLTATAPVREGNWTVAPPPPPLRDRRVEITGPTDRKMVINALNSGARGYMADFEDSSSPTWENMVGGQVNIADAVRGTIELTGPDGREYRLGEERATLLVRPRGWHLPERHVLVDGDPVAGGLFDFALFLFHNAEELLARGAGPYLYLPKLESHLEARLWNSAFLLAQDRLGLDRGSVRATVLIETLPAAFEMDEILYELREHSAGLNAGRWDYIFSTIKRFRQRPEFVLPDRSQVTMTVPFMRAYTDLLVATCHRRGAHAMGGMAAVIPSRTDRAAAERAFEAVRSDKAREAAAGFDGTWVAHPDSVPPAMREFDAVLGDRSRPGRARPPGGHGRGVGPAGGRCHARRDNRGGTAGQHQRGDPVHLLVAARQRCRGHLRVDGGRRDGRDLALTGVAMDPPLRGAGGRTHGHPGAGARAGDRGARSGSGAR